MLAAVTFATEDAEALEPELRVLLPAHMAEFEVYGEPFEPAPDFDAYKRLARAGMLIAVTARAEGELVGYWLGLKFPDPHHCVGARRATVLMAQAHHIVKRWRARVAPGFFRHLDQVAGAAGVDFLAQRVRPGERTEGFLSAIGYQRQEAVYVKRV